jgi:AmiR/NasT family two-component response regulator
VTDAPRTALRVLLADEDRKALRALAGSLRELGHEVIDLAVEPAEVVEAVAREEPDVSLVKVHADRDHALNLIGELSAVASGPVVALVPEEDPEFVADAADEGIDAYTAGVGPEALQSAMELAIRRHAELAALSEKVDQLESALGRRAVIERAKGILMERHDLDDRAAFERLRREARSTNRRAVDVASAVVEGRGRDAAGHNGDGNGRP